jgi:[ribosomal protein S18]-alanine N-acetyltransferase
MSAVLPPAAGAARPHAAAAALPPLHPLQLADIDAVAALEARSYAHPWSRGNFADSLKAAYVAQVARLPGGELLAYFIAMPGLDELHLLNLTVAPEHQGRGYGRALLEAVVAQARAQPAQALLLEVRDSNQRAQALYASRGFEPIGLRKRYYPARNGREDAVVMRLLLTQKHGLD